MEAKIKLTQRMLNKSIIDANKTVTAFAKEWLPVDYDHLENGQRCGFDALLVTQEERLGADGKFHMRDVTVKSQLRMYRRPRGDELLSIKGLKAVAKAGDTLTFLQENDFLEDGFRYWLIIKLERGEG